MQREFTVISALGGTEVPVPETVALCTDPDVLGATFYLMSFVDGVVLDRPAAVGLGEFGRPEGFLARQVRRWHQQWQANETEQRDVITDLLGRLTGTMPAQSPAGIVHGDYRLTNVMYRPDLDGIAAVVDWEMATLGDPLTDVGLLVVYQTLSADGDFVMPRMSPADGFPTADEMVARYAENSDRDLSALDWYVAFGYFKLGVISEGIHNRYLQGKTVGEGFSHFGDSGPRLLDTALLTLSAR